MLFTRRRARIFLDLCAELRMLSTWTRVKYLAVIKEE